MAYGMRGTKIGEAGEIFPLILAKNLCHTKFLFADLPHYHFELVLAPFLGQTILAQNDSTKQY